TPPTLYVIDCVLLSAQATANASTLRAPAVEPIDAALLPLSTDVVRALFPSSQSASGVTPSWTSLLSVRVSSGSAPQAASANTGIHNCSVPSRVITDTPSLLELVRRAVRPHSGNV